MSVYVSYRTDGPSAVVLKKGIQGAAGGVISAGPGVVFVTPLNPIILSVFNGINSNVGDTAGGYTVTIRGQFFTGTTSVTFGGVNATSIVVVSDAVLTCTVPAHAAGTVDVIVTTNRGANAAGNQAWTYFSTTQLAWAGLWRDYPGAAPWAGTASAGTSGANSLATGGADPSSGAALHGHVPANYAGNKLLDSIATSTAFLGSTGSFYALFFANTAPAPYGAAYTDGTFWTDSANAETSFGFTASGINGCILDDSVTYRRIDVACGTGAWHLAQFRFDGVNLQARVDGGSWSSISCGPFTPINPSSTRVGDSYAHLHLDGQIAELGVGPFVGSDTDFDNVRAACATRYGVTV